MTEASGADYTGRVIAVTGAGRGLGRLLIEYFLDRGASVTGVSRSPVEIEHANYVDHPTDVGDAEQVRSTFLEIGQRHGRLDIVVNNAAVLTSTHALVMPANHAEAMVRTNILGVLYVAREAAKVMKRGRFGRIINIGSMAAVLEPIGDSVYAATKRASMTLAGVMAKEFAGYGITVNTVAVTALDTEMLDQLSPQRIDAVVSALPLPRRATADDIFNVVDFLAAERSGYITAQTIFLGGLHE